MPSKNWIKAISIHLIRKTFPVFHIYSVTNKNHAYLTYSQQIFHRVTEEILSPTTFVTEWTCVGYCKPSDFFWLVFIVSSLPSLITMRFPHSSSVNTSLGESSKFSMSI